MSGPYLLLVHPSFTAKSVKDLIAAAKTKPGLMNFGWAGVGSAAHLVAEIFRSSVGADRVHVPYKASGPATIDLIAGQASRRRFRAGLKRYGRAAPKLSSDRNVNEAGGSAGSFRSRVRLD